MEAKKDKAIGTGYILQQHEKKREMEPEENTLFRSRKDFYQPQPFCLKWGY